MGKTLKETTARTADIQTDQRGYSISQDVCSAVKPKGRATAIGIEPSLPRKWLNITCWWKPFIFLCFSAQTLHLLYLSAFILSHKVFPSYFLPLPIKIRRVIQQLGGHQASSQCQLTTVALPQSSPHQKSHQKPYHRFVLRGHHPSHGLWCQHQQTVPSPGGGQVLAAGKWNRKKINL